MNTNINDIAGRFTADTIEYDDSSLSGLIEKLGTAETLISETISSQLADLSSSESLWKGKAKEQYLGLKDFLTQYQADYSSSVTEFKTVLTGLETLFGDIPSSTVIKEIDNA